MWRVVASFVTKSLMMAMVEMFITPELGLASRVFAHEKSVDENVFEYQNIFVA